MMEFYPPKITMADAAPFEKRVEGVKRCYVVNITKKEYNICDKYSVYRKCNTKDGDYGKGLLATKKDPFKPSRVGLLGELAFAKVFIGLKVDLKYRACGDDCDFIMKLDNGNRVKIDMKTADYNYGSNWVTVESEFGYEMELKSDIYVCSFIMKKIKPKYVMSIAVVGWQTRKFVSGLPTEESHLAGHKVKKLYFKDLHPIQSLFDLYYFGDETYMKDRMREKKKVVCEAY